MTYAIRSLRRRTLVNGILGWRLKAEELGGMWRREDGRKPDRRLEREAAASKTANRKTALASTTITTAREKSKVGMTERTAS